MAVDGRGFTQLGKAAISLALKTPKLPRNRGKKYIAYVCPFLATIEFAHQLIAVS